MFLHLNILQYKRKKEYALHAVHPVQKCPRHVDVAINTVQSLILILDHLTLLHIYNEKTDKLACNFIFKLLFICPQRP